MLTLYWKDKGKRVELISCDDQYTRLRPGDKGTYLYCDIQEGLIQHNIRWDSGSTLMLVGGHDSFKFIEGEAPQEHKDFVKQLEAIWS